jgi:glutathione S-transferase
MSAAQRVLYDLAGADPALRFSPFCWRTRMALAHKGLEVETVPWRFTDKDVIAFSGQGRVPVLVDGERVVSDSFAIALYLEETYPDRPSLFGGPGGVALSRFINTFADTVIHPWISRLIVSDILEVLHEKDRAYFRDSREAHFGRPLGEVTVGREAALPEFQSMLQPLRRHLQGLPFVGGENPLYADYVLFGGFQWARCTSTFELLASEDPIRAWRDRVLDLFESLARQAPCQE